MAKAIIVRDKKAKKTLPEELRGNLVFTALEAKGMEFEYVLVYNFFSDSPADQEWRVIHELKSKNLGKTFSSISVLETNSFHPILREQSDNF